MTLECFWSIVAAVHKESKGDMDAKCDLLEKRLRRLSLEELCSFEERFTEHLYRAYSWELWAAAYIIGGGCSDDSFQDFRSTLISMGRETFERALADPECLADMNYDSENAHYEGYQYVASRVFEELSGREDFPRFRPHPKEPSGKDWDENRVAEFYPRLAKKYAYKS